MNVNADIHQGNEADKLLWNKFLDGDEDSFEQIYRQYVNNLFRYGMTISNDKDFVKDCIHDMFIKIYNNRANLSATDNIMFYLLFALKNTLINALKRNNDKIVYQYTLNDSLNLDEKIETPESIYLEKELQNITDKTVEMILQHLTPRQREIIHCRYVLGMSIEEISKLIEINYQSVQNIIQRSLDRIRNLMQK